MTNPCDWVKVTPQLFPAGIESRTRDLLVTSPTLEPLGQCQLNSTHSINDDWYSSEF